MQYCRWLGSVGVPTPHARWIYIYIYIYIYIHLARGVGTEFETCSVFQLNSE
jgi:hypothetical protein